LLVRCAEIDIDANSELLLSLDSKSNLTPNRYIAQRDAEVEKLKVINRLRAHTKLLAHYFELLIELSTSKAPQETATAIENTVKNINELGTELRGSSLLDNNAKTLIDNVTKLIVTAKIRKALDDELKARNETIRAELTTQEELLKALANDITQNLKIENVTRERRLVIDPLVAPAPIPPGQIDPWKANRKTAITASATVDDLKNASQAVGKLKEAYEALLSGKLDIARINDALDDFDSIISTAESLKNITGDNK
jgi:hypothetical protein